MTNYRSFEGLNDWEASGRTAITRSNDPLVKELLRACSAGERVCVHYSGGSGPPRQRWIKPKAVYTKDGYSATYVEAFCEERHADRVFRTDRMRLVKAVGQSAPQARIANGDRPAVQPRSRKTASVAAGATSSQSVRRVTTRGAKAPRTKPAWQRFNRFVSYYLDCIREDEGFGVGVRLKDAGDKWLPLLGQQEWSTSGEDSLVVPLSEADRSFASYVLQGGTSTSLLYGYPIAVLNGRDGSTTTMFPVFVLPVDHSIQGSILKIARADDWPRLNPSFTEALGLRAEETRALLDGLGLGLSNTEPPEGGLGALGLRLAELQVLGEVAEVIDPQALNTPTGRPIEVGKTGVFNWSGLFFSDRPTYTKSLERELTQLRDFVSEEDLDESALRFFFDPDVVTRDIRGRQGRNDVTVVSPLNEAQVQSVAAGLDSSVTVVTGPPGTGKSQVVVNLLANALLAGQSVLFSSRNNKAVEVVEARTSALSRGRLLLRAGSRYSNRDFRAEIVKFLTHVLATQAGEAERAEARRLRDRLEVIKNQQESVLDRLERVRVARDRVNELDLLIAPLLQALPLGRRKQLKLLARDEMLGKATKVIGSYPIESPDVPVAPANEHINWFRHLRNKGVARKAINLLRAYEELIPELLRVENLAHVCREDLGRGIEELRRTLGLAASVSEYKRAFELLMEAGSPVPLAEQMLQLENDALDLGRALVDTEGDLVAARLDSSSRRALGELKATMERLSGEGLESSAYAKLRAELNRVFPQVTRAVPLWCVTNLSVGGTFPLGAGLFDLVVIDEASQCDIPSAIPLLYRAKKAMIIGDPNQLRHISKLAKSRDRQLQHVHDLENTSDQPYTFGTNSLFDLASSSAVGVRVTELVEHFRSHEDIVRFSNSQWYGGRLRVCTDYEHLMSVPGGLGVEWTDAGASSASRSRAQRNTAPEEAAAIVDLLCKLAATPDFRGSLGVVTPFRAQANLIKRLVNERLEIDQIQRTDLIVDTAHGFQGDERDVVFLSPCVNRDLSAGGRLFLTHTENLFNVAITRARSRLHVVGDLNGCLNCGIEYVERFAAEYGPVSRRMRDEYLPWVASQDNVGYYERPLYQALVAEGLKPIPQYSEGPYKLDLALVLDGLKLNVEVDGEYFHSTWSGDQARLDLRRDIRLIERGWKIKRFWAQEVRDDVERCAREVLALVEASSG